MGIPIELTIFFSFVALFLLLLTLVLLFIEPNFNKSIFAFILTFINSIYCFFAAAGFLVTDLYGFDASGGLISNLTSDFYPYAIIFWFFIYFNVLFAIYAIYLMYQKPWKEAIKSHGYTRYNWFEEVD